MYTTYILKKNFQHIYMSYIKYIFNGIFTLHCYEQRRAQLILTARKTLTHIATKTICQQSN